MSPETAQNILERVNWPRHIKLLNYWVLPRNIHTSLVTVGWLLWLGSLDSLPQEHFTGWSAITLPWTPQIAWAADSFEENLLRERKI